MVECAFTIVMSTSNELTGPGWDGHYYLLVNISPRSKANGSFTFKHLPETFLRFHYSAQLTNTQRPGPTESSVCKLRKRMVSLHDSTIQYPIMELPSPPSSSLPTFRFALMILRPAGDTPLREAQGWQPAPAFTPHHCATWDSFETRRRSNALLRSRSPLTRTITAPWGDRARARSASLDISLAVNSRKPAALTAWGWPGAVPRRPVGTVRSLRGSRRPLPATHWARQPAASKQQLAARARPARPSQPM